MSTASYSKFLKLFFLMFEKLKRVIGWPGNPVKASPPSAFRLTDRRNKKSSPPLEASLAMGREKRRRGEE